MDITFRILLPYEQVTGSLAASWSYKVTPSIVMESGAPGTVEYMRRVLWRGESRYALDYDGLFDAARAAQGAAMDVLQRLLLTGRV